MSNRPETQHCIACGDRFEVTSDTGFHCAACMRGMPEPCHQPDEWWLNELRQIADLTPADKTLIGYARTLGIATGKAQGILEALRIEKRSPKQQSQLDAITNAPELIRRLHDYRYTLCDCNDEKICTPHEIVDGCIDIILDMVSKPSPRRESSDPDALDEVLKIIVEKITAIRNATDTLPNSAERNTIWTNAVMLLTMLAQATPTNDIEGGAS